MNRSGLNTQIIAVAFVITSILFVCFTAQSVLAGLTAVVTANNDFTTDERPLGKTVPVPRIVEGKINALVDKAYDKIKGKPSWKQDFPRDSFFGPIFRIAAPNNRELYVFRRTGPVGTDFFFFILFDPKTKKITHSPPYIYAKWMQGDWGAELQKPLLSFQDIDGDGQEEYVVQERVHNGTMYNAVVYHYYYISSDLALHPILAVETRLDDLFAEDRGCIINRTLQVLGKKQIRPDVSLDCQVSPPQHRRLGYVVLHSTKPGSPFSIVERTIIEPRYAPMLITASEEDEAKFIIEGYRFYY